MINNTMNKHHIIYKTTHENGKYYIGRHSTDNLEDGYLGSGLWVNSIKDKTTLTREILEFAPDKDALVLMEGSYLQRHYGKPNCMNMTDTPDGLVAGGWNPMHNPDSAAKISGDNHWSKTDPEKFQEQFSGEAHWMNKNPTAKREFIDNHPNKDGRNAKAAMKNGTHVNLTNNPSVQRSKDGTHQMFRREDGSSIGADANQKRLEEGTHNFLGSELNSRRVSDGTHNLLGSTQNEAMLAAGTHPSQQKRTCEHCDKTVSVSMYVRWHGPRCKAIKPSTPA